MSKLYNNSEKYLLAMEKLREEQKKKFLIKCSKINGDTIDLSSFDYNGSRYRSTCKCKICGHVWDDVPEILYKRKVCPKCHEKQKMIERRNNILLKNKIKAEKLYIDKNYDNIEFFYDDRDELMVKFICREKYCDGTEHGEQIQTGTHFLKDGNGCAKCSSHLSKAYTTEEWVRIAKHKYPEFTYEKTKYVNKETKVIVTCEKHGEFEIIPKELISGRLYCPECTKERLHNEFVNRVIERATKVHKDCGYIYHPELIISSTEKIGIECPKHGIFWQSIQNHITNKSKCPLCAIETTKNNIKKKKEEFNNIFIERAKTIHDDKYTYEKTIYKGNEIKVIITCPEHGDFLQTPHSHLGGGGCPTCARLKCGESIRITEDDFFRRIREVHKNEKYDFSKIVYSGYNEKITVICPKHGEFNIKACSFMRGQGCPICKLPKLEKDVRDILIDNNIEFKQQKYFKKWLGRQSLDFYIKEKNIAIECQGLQHFKNERRYQNLELVQERDRKKKQLCKENNVHLIYYLPAVFAKYMDKDDIFFTNVSDLVEYIKNY